MNKQRLIIFALMLLISACSTKPQRWARDTEEMKLVLLGPLYEEKERYDFRYPLLLQSVLNEITFRQKEHLRVEVGDRISQLQKSNWYLENERIQNLQAQIDLLKQKGQGDGRSLSDKVRILQQEIGELVSAKAGAQAEDSSFPELKIVYESNPGFTNKVNRAWHQIQKIREKNKGVFDNAGITHYLNELDLHQNLFSLAIRIVPPPAGKALEIRLQGYRFINVEGKLVDANGFDFTFNTTPRRLREDLTRAVVRLIISDEHVTPSLGMMGFVKLNKGCLEEGEQRSEPECVEDVFVGRYPVTVQQWTSVMEVADDAFLKKQNPLNPVVNVNWNQVQSFIKKLNSQSKLDYRLPTTTEWEYACKGGGNSLVYGTGANRISHRTANYLGRGERDIWAGLSPVGSFYPNLIGLYDMSGNTWEWTEDEADFAGRGTKHVVKGGSFDSVESALSCHHSASSLTGMPALDIGFRLVID